MNKKFVIVQCDVHCEWKKHPPVYRVYVEDELFAERTFIWDNQYLIENLQILADPGKYSIRFELVGKSSAELRVENIRIATGPEGSRTYKNNVIRIAQ
jgi:hypothetical protein